MSQGYTWQKHFRFGKSSAVQRLKRSRLSAQSAEDFDGSIMHVKHTLARRSGGIPPSPRKIWNLGSLRVHLQLLVVYVSVSQGTNFVYS